MDFIRDQYLPALYEKKLSKDHDRVVIVLGSEGSGKSTLMLQTAWFHRQVCPELEDPSVDSVMSDVAWDRDGYRSKLAEGHKYRPIIVHDAARVMSKKKAMHSEQVELEEDLFDSRYGRNLQLLGYQDWNHVPTLLQTRRAENVFHVTSRGKVHIYGRSDMDKKVDTGSWPSTNVVDTFDHIEGTELWKAFRSRDEEEKMKRLEPDEDEQVMTVQEVIDEILEEGVEEYISIHGGNGTKYIDADLIGLDYGLSNNKSRQAKKALEREVMASQ